MKPKIQIIRIFAPEIIKTDVQNFRELVQRLTGKPPEKPSRLINKKRTRKLDEARGFQGKKMEGEEEIWKGANSGGGLGGCLPEVDGFMDQLNNQFFALQFRHCRRQILRFAGHRDSQVRVSQR